MIKRILAASGDAADLPMLYEELKRRFPEENLHSYAQFDALFREMGYCMLLLERESDRSLIGYCLSFPVLGSGVVWLDYFAVREEYERQGYGKVLFQMLTGFYREHADAFLFPAKHIGGAQEAERCARFYEAQGARRCQGQFFPPEGTGVGKPVDLYQLPFSQGYCLTARKQKTVLAAVYSVLMRDADREACRACELRSAETISDEPPFLFA